jgi:hypothetical protein
MRECVRTNGDTFVLNASARTMAKADRTIAKIQGHLSNLDSKLNAVAYQIIRRSFFGPNAALWLEGCLAGFTIFDTLITGLPRLCSSFPITLEEVSMHTMSELTSASPRYNTISTLTVRHSFHPIHSPCMRCLRVPLATNQTL